MFLRNRGYHASVAGSDQSVDDVFETYTPFIKSGDIDALFSASSESVALSVEWEHSDSSNVRIIFPIALSLQHCALSLQPRIIKNLPFSSHSCWH
jgi:hypothetical protein